MFFWSAYPFARITLAFALGIIGAVFMPGYQNTVFLLTGTSILFLFTSAVFKKKWFLKTNWVFGLIVVVLGFVLGYSRLFFEQNDLEDAQLAEASSVSAYQAEIISQPINKGKYYKSTARVSLLKDSI